MSQICAGLANEKALPQPKWSFWMVYPLIVALIQTIGEAAMELERYNFLCHIKITQFDVSSAKIHQVM